jgi:hypothetical protein
VLLCSAAVLYAWCSLTRCWGEQNETLVRSAAAAAATTAAAAAAACYSNSLQQLMVSAELSAPARMRSPSASQ